jgi:hypothetical protein
MLLSCEGCHGSLALTRPIHHGHPVLPDPAVLCLRCHEKNEARPAGFPQIVPEEHAGAESCASCHQPHRPDQFPEAKP